MLATSTVPAKDDRAMTRDLRILVRFIGIYCKDRHDQTSLAPVHVAGVDLDALNGKPLLLCPECGKLLAHAVVKRTHCRMDPKPACKHCPVHCYHPDYRSRIREVMKHSGRKMLLGGRLDYLFHILF